MSSKLYTKITVSSFSEENAIKKQIWETETTIYNLPPERRLQYYQNLTIT